MFIGRCSPPKLSKSFKDFLKDERGQLDVVGNILTVFFEFVKTQPWILTLSFLAFLVLTTVPFKILTIEFRISDLLTVLLNPIAKMIGINFVWDQFVILCFLVVVLQLVFFLQKK
jgi:hypothetical protein